MERFPPNFAFEPSEEDILEAIKRLEEQYPASKPKPKPKPKPKLNRDSSGSLGNALLGSVGAKRKPKMPDA